MRNDSYCLVLSGGGAKGIYHIGVWRALKELGIQVDAFIGNSIGAIIAVFLVQGLDKELEEIGNQIGLDYIVNVPEELIKDGELSVHIRKRKAFHQFYRNTISKKGLDTSPLRNLLEAHIDEKEIRGNGKDLGVVAYNVSEMKPREVFIEEMEEGELVSYAMASSAFPGFESPKIGGKKYIDGGVHDNIPFAMARSRGYRNIIVVDISGIGVKRKPDIEGVRTIYIKNSIDMGGVLDFNRKFLNDFNRLGYLDTMRVFGRYCGIDYFIVPDAEKEKEFRTYLESAEAAEILFSGPYFRRKDIADPKSVTAAVRKLLPKKSRHDRRWLPIFADCAAKILSVERIREWDYEELFKELTTKRDAVKAQIDALKESDRKKTETRIRREVRKRNLIRTPYFYYLLAGQYLPEKLKRPLMKLVSEWDPGLSAGISFLDLMDGFRLNKKQITPSGP